jgi:hypothetical protein
MFYLFLFIYCRFGHSNYEFKCWNVGIWSNALCVVHYCAYLFCLFILHDGYGVVEDDQQRKFF